MVAAVGWPGEADGHPAADEDGRGRGGLPYQNGASFSLLTIGNLSGQPIFQIRIPHLLSLGLAGEDKSGLGAAVRNSRTARLRPRVERRTRYRVGLLGLRGGVRADRVHQGKGRSCKSRATLDNEENCLIKKLAAREMTRTARTDDQGQRDPARTRQPDWLEPELATLTADRFSDPAWIFERKFDGERCLAFRAGQQLRLMTRNQQQVTSTYPEIADALRAQEASDFIVDGEVVAFDGDRTSFSRLQRRLGVSDPGPALRAEVPVYLYVFDLLWADGRDVRPLPLRERKRLLRGLLSFRDPLRFTEHRDTDGEAYWREACIKGWEGIIAKRADSPYRPGRTRDWLKFKCENAQEFVIGGYTDPRGSRTGFGALLLGYYDSDGKLRYAGKVGTGFDRRTLTSLHAALAADERPEPPFEPVRGLPRSGVHWVEPRLVAQVGFTEWTADGQLRHPRFQGLRRDKDPADVVREMP